jgi:hypothetical protein
MSTHYGGKVYRNVAEITGPSGFYNVKTSLGTVVVYVNQEYSGGGWVLVLANRQSTGGMNNLSYHSAVNKSTYRTSSTVTSAPRGIGLADFNCWVGTRYWQELTGRVTAGKVTVVQYVSGTNGTALNGSHTKRYRWRFNNFTATYGFSGAEAVSDETSTGAPGFYSYHAANGFNLTTFDNDQDVEGGNCSTYYNNNPFWYGNCWSGNYFGGGSGYVDAPYWDSSGADYHQYGAVYIK